MQRLQINGCATIQLKHNQGITLQDIPAGYTYRITESSDEWYSVNDPGALREGTIVNGTTENVSFHNTRKGTTLSLKKTVEGNFGNKTKLFDFEVYVIDEGRELTGTYDMKIVHGDNTETTSTVTFTEGATIIQLQHDDVATISNLPVGARYELDELVNSRRSYVMECTNDAGVLDEDSEQAEFINTKAIIVPTGAITPNSLLIAVEVIACAFVATRIYIKLVRNKKAKAE